MSLGGALRVLVAELASVGLDPAAVCRAAGVSGDGAPIGLDDLGRVLAHAEAVSGDPLLGLHMAERAQGRGVLSYLARAQRTVGEGLLAFSRFANTTWGAGVIRVERRGARGFVGFHLAPELPRHAVEFLLARTARALPRRPTATREAWFGHAPGGPTPEYERVLRCRARFRQRETGLSLPADDFARPLRTANPEAAAALATALAQPPAPRATTMTARVAAAVEASLARGRPIEREALARSLGMGGKTLARRLALEQRRFSDVVDDVRRTLARRLVADDALDLGEVAARVGFADLTAFGKAFRRWFGEPPSAARARRTAG
jgi:AraC-like DNA-binding protein